MNANAKRIAYLLFMGTPSFRIGFDASRHKRILEKFLTSFHTIAKSVTGAVRLDSASSLLTRG
jgi:hypothetical protein